MENNEYKIGDIANGHILTEQGWSPLAPAITTKKGGKGKKIAIIGGSILFGLVACTAAVGGGTDTTSTTDEPSASAESEEAKPEPSTAEMGDAVRDGKFEFTILDMVTDKETYGDGFLEESAQGSFTIITVRVENIGDEAQMFTASNIEGVDSKGRTLDAETGYDDAFLEDINPGNEVTADVAFDVADGVTLESVVVHDSMFSDGVEVSLS